MAIYLYRLGRFAARRAWLVVLAWLLILGIVGGGAAALGQPFTKELTIPGTEFQRVLDDLEESLPDAAGGRAGVVFSTADGTPFTQEQKNAIAEVTRDWSTIEGVDEVSNPFTTQADIDEGRRAIADGKVQLADGEDEVADNRKKLTDGEKEITDGRAEIAENETKLADGEKKLGAGEVELAQGEVEIAKNEAKLNAGRAELEAGQRAIDEGRPQLAEGQQKLAAGQAEIDANRATITAGEQQLKAGSEELVQGEAEVAAARKRLADGRAQIEAAREELNAGKAQVAAGKQRIADGRAELEAGRERITAGRAQIAEARAQADALAAQNGADDPQVVAMRAQLDEQEATLDAAEASLPQQEAELDAAAAQLAEREPALAEGEKELDAQESELAAGEKQLAEQAAPLEEARATLDAKTAELNAGKAKLDAAQKELDAGKATLAEKAAELAAGQQKIDEGQAQLAEGQAQLDAGKAKLAAGNAEIAANRITITSGKTQLAQGRVDVENAARQITEGKAKLEDATATIAEKKAELERGERRLALMDGLRAVNEGGDVAMASVSFTTPVNEVPQATKDILPEKAEGLAAHGVQVDYSKDISQSIAVGGASEAIGLLIAAIILFVMLGSLLAAGLPLLIALVGVGTGIMSVLALTYWVDMNDVTPALAVMLGLAVGIDYALFIVHRHRENLASGETDVHESIGLATGTAGSAVLFAGATVVVALAALTLVNIPFLGIMGLAAAGTVAAAVLVALTLTPALLGLMGTRVLSRRARRRLAAEHEREESEAEAEDIAEAETGHAPRGRGWGGLVTSHPVIAGAIATVALLIFALPAASLQLGLPDASQDPQDSTSYRAYTTIADGFGPGQNAAILAVATVEPGEARHMTEAQATDLQLDIGEHLKDYDGVAYVVPAAISDDQRTLVYQIVPTGGPNDESTQNLIHDMRDGREALVEDTAIESLGFAGQTVANIDMSELLAGALPTYLLVVVGISLVLLLLVFRSVVVPLLATGGFLLSIAAAFGAVVAVYQWGWGGSLFGVENPGVILSFLPTLAIGILFGLAMDYQMFLVSGMREAWAHGHTARTAVRTGFSHGAKVVTAAALIMTGVFSSFMHSPTTMIRPIGFVLAVGVLVDAFIVRMTIMPAAMHLLGEKAWYLPRWLDRMLPDLDVEGTKLLAMRRAAAHPGADAGAEAVPTETAPTTAFTPAGGSPAASDTARSDDSGWGTRSHGDGS